MHAQDFWNLFLKTGSPEAYLAYTNALKMEGDHVPDDPGNRPQSHGLQ